MQYLYSVHLGFRKVYRTGTIETYHVRIAYSITCGNEVRSSVCVQIDGCIVLSENLGYPANL